MNQETAGSPIYTEVQRFRQGWVWILIIVIAVIMWALIIEQLLLSNPLGQPAMPVILLIVFWLLFGIGFPALFLFGGLHTQVRPDGIYVQFKPFHLSPRKLAFGSITRCEVRTYKALREYGGWGIKCGKGGLSYTVSGDKGLQLKFTENRPLLIGSQRAEELYAAVRPKLNLP
ncbi:MAG: hypothetical protein JSV52_03160 [Candidatus Zixiibacteriota bacterium]|nr:MAG: hypothetical protein JSV52_03160 [candidate division Zixibacteria bacterium]